MATSSPILARFFKDYVRAGDLYYQRGRLTRAVDMYAKAESFDQAARTSLEIGDIAGAVEFLERAGNPLRAGELLAEHQRYKEAIQQYEKAGAFGRAAEASLSLKQFERAARYFEKANQLVQAATCHEKAGELDSALACLSRESQRLAAERRSGGDASVTERNRQIDLRRAGLLERLRRGKEAGEILASWGMAARAAELLEQAGQHDQAARAYLDSGEAERALAILDRAAGLEPEEQAAILRLNGRHLEAGEVLESAGLASEAAEAFEVAGEWERAAGLLERFGQHAHAADLYSRAEKWQEAARCYSSAGKMANAADAFAKVPDHGSAAACYANADRSLQAAHHYLKAGDEASASTVLQGIGQDDAEFERATMMLVPLLVGDGLFTGALHRLELLSTDASDGTGSISVERHYWEARAFEGLGRLDEALAGYQRVVALRRDHRDVAERFVAVRRRREVEREEDATRGSTAITTPIDVRDQAREVAEPEVGVVLAGRYRLLEEIGRGGMGRVYKADDSELGEPVALKTLLSGAGLDSGDQDRLLREVQICRRITHPNVVRVYDMGRFSGGIFVTMEMLEGETIDARIKRDGAMSLPAIKNLLRQVLSGLREAHGLKVVHRDLKPSNIFLTGDRAKLLDFGIARMEGSDVDITSTGEIIGSPKYMSPEQIQGEELDARSDLYSLGVIVYYLLTAVEPFTGKTPSVVALKQLRDPPPDITQYRETLPKAWRTFVDRLMVKDRRARLGSADEVLAVLKALPEVE